MNNELFERLLNYYEIDEQTYKEITRPVDENSFAVGHCFDNIQKAVQIVKDTINNKGKIFIYGDYDADGVMGTSILVKMFSYLNYKVESYLPNRYVDGYGITLSKAQECINNKVDLVITVDNGIGAIEQIKLLKDNGIKVLVLDHHTVGEIIPNADVILHPTYSHFGETASSGAFVSFMFSIALLGRFDKYLSTLAAISLISDMMPLKDYNRNLLRVVIDNYKDGEFKCIDVLKENDPFDENAIGMRIAPKINAIGRIVETNEINKLVEFFTSDNEDVILTSLSWINDTNTIRKEISKESVDNIQDVDPESPSIIYICNAKEGLLGLIANHLMMKYKKPVIVFTLDNSKLAYKGSARAPEGFNIVDSFNKLKDYFIAYGGHNLAAGCTISIEKIEDFKKEFNKIVLATPIEIKEKKCIPLNITEINFDNYKMIKSFGPFGENWIKPLFKISHINVSSLFYSKSGEHIITQIGSNAKITGFNISKELLSDYKFVDFFGTLRTSTFRNIVSIEFLVNDFQDFNK